MVNFAALASSTSIPLSSSHISAALRSIALGTKPSVWLMTTSSRNGSAQLLPSRHLCVTSVIIIGNVSPSACHRLAPSTIHARIPWASACSFCGSSLSISASANWRGNGIGRSRRQMPQSEPRTSGRSFTASKMVNCGTYSKLFPRMNRATIGSPPVACFTIASESFRPRSTSTDVTNRAPFNRARSSGCLLPLR